MLFYEYTRSQKSKIKEYELVRALLCHAEKEVSESGRALAEAVRSFSDQAPNTEALKSAVLSSDWGALRASLPEADGEDIELISDFFSEPSAPSYKEEGERIRDLSRLFKEKHGALKSGYSDKSKVAFTIFCTAVAFAFFLLA